MEAITETATYKPENPFVETAKKRDRSMAKKSTSPF
jgi:hypothetical protein